MASFHPLCPTDSARRCWAAKTGAALFLPISDDTSQGSGALRSLNRGFPGTYAYPFTLPVNNNNKKL